MASLPRCMRMSRPCAGCCALSSFGLVREEGGADCWELTPAGELLRGDVPGSMRDLARWFAADAHYAAWGALEHSVRTGESAFTAVHGEDCWDYLVRHPDLARAFNLGMSSLARSFHRAILDVYDFSGIGTLVDVGGGQGELMAAILARYPAMRGIVFDLERVMPETRAKLRERELDQRCQAVGGSFFDSVPRGDAYIMTAILHDWDDERAVAILRNCRAAMNPGGRVLVGDFVLKPSNEPDSGKVIDLEMLVMTGSGRERTEAEFRRLFGEAGLEVTRTVPTPAGHCVVEGVPR
jgi:O-methyltransferase domain